MDDNPHVRVVLLTVESGAASALREQESSRLLRARGGT